MAEVTEQVQHSPLPWMVVDREHDVAIVPQSDGWRIARFPKREGPDGHAKKMAEFICRAVNSHDALVAALRLADEFTRAVSLNNAGMPGDDADWYRMREILASALALAESR